MANSDKARNNEEAVESTVSTVDLGLIRKDTIYPYPGYFDIVKSLARQFHSELEEARRTSSEYVRQKKLKEMGLSEYRFSYYITECFKTAAAFRDKAKRLRNAPMDFLTTDAKAQFNAQIKKYETEAAESEGKFWNYFSTWFRHRISNEFRALTAEKT